MTGSGRVISVQPSEVVVATRSGTIKIDRSVDATAYRNGDTVRVVGGIVVGRRRTVTKTVRV